jgi:hypothetical protein
LVVNGLVLNSSCSRHDLIDKRRANKLGLMWL